MINEKKKLVTGSWLSGLLSTEIFISIGEWGSPPPPPPPRGEGGPDANTDREKQSISAVRASGGFPGKTESLPYVRESRTSKTCPILGGNLAIPGTRSGPVSENIPCFLVKSHNSGTPKWSGLRKHTLFMRNLMKSHPVLGKLVAFQNRPCRALLIRSVGCLSKCFYQSLRLVDLNAVVIGQSINKRGVV